MTWHYQRITVLNIVFHPLTSDRLSGIRVTYSGLISFVVGIGSLLTGILFTLITTRSLSPVEFGTWNLIGALITYVTIVEPIASYWSTREIARGIESGRTAFFSSGIFSAGGVLAYVIIAYFISGQVHADKSVVLFAGILVPAIFLNKTLTAINLAWKPQSTSYGTLAFEFTKVPSALLFVYFLHMGLLGAILSTFVATFVSIMILLVYAREKIRERVKKELLRKWLRLSWLSVYPAISNLVFYLDVVVFSIMSGSVIGLAFYSTSFTIASLGAYAALISRAVYTKLLEGGKVKHLEDNLLRFFYLAFPLSAISIVFAKPALFALKPVYVIAVPVVIFLTLRALLHTVDGLFYQSLLGIEKVDIDENSKFKDYLKSNLFFVPTIILIQVSVYVIALLLGLLFLKQYAHETIDLVIYWSIISVGTQIPFTIYYYLLTRKFIKFKINSILLLKYILVCVVVFGITYLLMNQFLIYENNVFKFVPRVLLLVSIGMIVYLFVTYLVDSKTRILFHAILDELKGKSA